MTDPFQLNTETVGDQIVPRIFGIENGGFVALWYRENAYADGLFFTEVIRGRVFESDGTPRGIEFELEDQRPPLVATSRGDSLIIRDDVGNDRALGLFALDGTRLDHWSVADQVPDVGSQLSIARSHDQNIVVAWDEAPFGNVVAQIFDANGQPRPQAKIVVSLEGPPNNRGVQNPLVSAATDGSFAIAWWAEFSGLFWTRHFDGQGEPRGEPFAVTAGFSSGSFDLCMDRASGSSAIVWGEEALRFSPEGQPGDPICHRGRRQLCRVR